MRILIGIPCLLLGGTEMQTLNLAKALKKGGHDIYVVCYFEYHPEIITAFKSAGCEVSIISPDGFRPKGVVNTFLFLKKRFKKLINRLQPDFVHLQYMAPGALAALAFYSAGAKKLICTSHTSGELYSPLGLQIFRFLSKYLFHATQLVSMEAEKSYFGSAQLFKEGEHVQKGSHLTIYNSLPSYIRIISHPRTHGKDMTIGVVSRLEAIKGMDLVIPVFAQIAREFPKIKFLIVGDGSLLSMMADQAKEYGIEDRTIFTGKIHPDCLEELYDKIDVLLIPSRSEGFGFTAVEGMARGCVPVASNVGGLKEIITSDCGFLHASEHTDSIIQQLKKVICDTELLNAMSFKAIQRASLFSFDRYCKLINQLYHKI